MFRLVDMNCALPAQSGHAEGAPEGDLYARDVEGQGVEIEKPFTDEVADVLQAQNFLIKHGDPLRTAAADQLFDGLGALQMEGLQTQEADITGAVAGIFQITTVDVPAHGAQSGQQAIAIVAGIDHQ